MMLLRQNIGIFIGVVFMQLLAVFRKTNLWQVRDKYVTVLVLGTAVFILCISVHSNNTAYRVLQSVGTGVW